MTAETSDPPAAPTGAIAPKSPRPRFRFLPGGKVMPSKATIFGTISPPPMPHRPLMKHMETRLVENPPQRAQSTHHTQPMWYPHPPGSQIHIPPTSHRPDGKMIFTPHTPYLAALT
ncbi:MAG: hypothetical protein Q9181_004574 [Wetmoreana brouardii]